MTRRTLTIAIDANRVTCGKCEHVQDTDDGHFCGLFVEQELREYYADIEPGSSAYDVERCAPCIAAEKGEAGE